MPWSEWAEYYGADLDELHLPLNFQLIETPWKARDVRMALEELESALPPGAWAVNNLGNHDRSRIASRYGQSGARLAAIMLLTARGTPLLYYGDELGMSDVSIPSERLRDGYSRRDGGPTRDPNRSPMQWSDADNAGFNDGGVEPWLPLAPDWRERNVQAELEDPRSVLEPIPSPNRTTSAVISAQGRLDSFRRSCALRLPRLPADRCLASGDGGAEFRVRAVPACY